MKLVVLLGCKASLVGTHNQIIKFTGSSTLSSYRSHLLKDDGEASKSRSSCSGNAPKKLKKISCGRYRFQILHNLDSQQWRIYPKRVGTHLWIDAKKWRDVPAFKPEESQWRALQKVTSISSRYRMGASSYFASRDLLDSWSQFGLTHNQGLRSSFHLFTAISSCSALRIPACEI